MSSLWRIARRPYALDRVGAGARDSGGRWNAVGIPVIYTGRTIGIAALEKFVHLSGIVPPDLVLVRIAVPDGASSETPGLADLPADWNAARHGPLSVRFGTRWAREKRSLVLYVPSAIIPEESIGVLNPNHPEFSGVSIGVEREFRYDLRMFARRTPRANA
jgi:RES domain-containing protein